MSGGETAQCYPIVVTGSRRWADINTIRRALTLAQNRNRKRLPHQVFHGQCDPRDPDNPDRVIPWVAAKKLLPAEQERLLGGDWLAECIALSWGWPEPKGYPADWKHRGAGFARNILMTSQAARSGPGECHAFILPCREPDCPILGVHGTHGAAHCAEQAGKAGLAVYPWPSPELDGHLPQQLTFPMEKEA